MMETYFSIDSKGFKDAYSMFSKPALLETCADLMTTMVPIWVAIAIGLVVGWSWKPRWVSFFVLGMRTRPRLVWSTPPGFGARRIWLALTAITAFPFLKEVWTKFRDWMWPDTISNGEDFRLGEPSGSGNGWALKDEDLVDFCKKVEGLDGGAEWSNMMHKTTGSMSYECWRREPMDGAGPGEYKSRTMFENVTSEEMRDFFWDDEFRSEWDDMLISSETWEECTRTGAMVVHWVRKVVVLGTNVGLRYDIFEFPVFCKDREYTISRRIWAIGKTFYCVTKAINYSKISRRSAPKRVDNYFSSWCIRPAESPKGDGNLTSCEVMLFHHEDMGIQRDLAKIGIRQGMWGCVKKMEPGIKAYQLCRKQGKQFSKSALMANVYTEISPNFVQTLSLPRSEESDDSPVVQLRVKPSKTGFMRWLVLGGAVALACGVDKGAVGKVLVFGMAGRFGKASQRRRSVNTRGYRRKAGNGE